jgi:hypothetical protein
MRFSFKPTASGCAKIGCGTCFLLLLAGFLYQVGLGVWSARTANAIVRQYERQGFRLKFYWPGYDPMTVEPIEPADFDDAALQRLIALYQQRTDRDAHLELKLDHCPKLTKLDALEGVQSRLLSVSLNNCGNLSNLEGLRKQQNLWSLKLNGCKKVTSVDALAGAHGLRSVELKDCTDLLNVDGLATHSELNDLKLAGCSALSKIDALGALGLLRRLDLTGCDQLRSIDQLKRCIQLEELNLSHCRELTSIAPLAGLPKLRRLNIAGCAKLNDLSPLARLNLRWLSLADNPQLTDLNALAKLPAVNWDRLILGLASLDAQRCVQLHDIKGLFNCHSLLQADFSGSPVAPADLGRLRQAFPMAHIDFREAK